MRVRRHHCMSHHSMSRCSHSRCRNFVSFKAHTACCLAHPLPCRLSSQMHLRQNVRWDIRIFQPFIPRDRFIVVHNISLPRQKLSRHTKQGRLCQCPGLCHLSSAPRKAAQWATRRKKNCAAQTLSARATALKCLSRASRHVILAFSIEAIGICNYVFIYFCRIRTKPRCSGWPSTT